MEPTGASLGKNPGEVKWPADMVDSGRLFEMLGHRVGDRNVIGEDAYDRVRRLELAVQRARDVNRIRRYAARDPLTNDVIGHGYKREDVQRIIDNGG